MTHPTPSIPTRLLPLAVVAAVLSGCASAPPSQSAQSSTAPTATATTTTTAPAPTANPADPWEGFNRSISGFNDTLDDAILTPLAKAWRWAVPQPLRTGVGNFFSNLGDLWSLTNHALQGEGEQAYHHLVRFSTNTVLGLGGVLDIATEARIAQKKQDFGNTLARWGVPPGPYLVLPVLGPSTLRDTAALPLDIAAQPQYHLHPASHAWGLTVVNFIDRRERLLSATDTLGAVALDRYALTRDFYLRLRDPGLYTTDDASAGKVQSYDD